MESGSADDRELRRLLQQRQSLVLRPDPRSASAGLVRVANHAGAAPKMMEEHAHHEHTHDEEESHEYLSVEETSVTETLSQIRAGVLEASNPVGEMVDALDARLKERELRARRAAEARQKGYEGDACGGCGNFTLVRNGTCMKCNTCGSTSGCS